jgi:putative transposase
MPDYRRAFLNGGTFFFTVVTYKRYPIFKEEPAVNLLRWCFQTTMATHPFKVAAIVILPDHLHTIWTLPDNESDFSTRWKLIKGTFSRHYSGFKPKDISESMLGKNEKGIWQRRFWEHAIRDQEDFNRHCDYIHYNPVKHGLVNSPMEWKYSSFRNLVEKGVYPANWGHSVGKELAGMDFE